MEGLNSKSRFQARILVVSVSILMQVLSTANGQSMHLCYDQQLHACLNYITGSSSNGTLPTSDCCSSLKDLMGASTDCACLLVTAGVPLPLNLNRSLSMSLPTACKSSGVPVQCQASGSPLPAPGPVLLGPPPSSSAFSPQASKAAATAPVAAPEAEAFPPANVEAPPTAARIRPVLTPSGSYTASSPAAFMLVFVGFVVARLY